MPKIDITDEMHRRVEHFRPVIEAVIDEEFDFNSCVELILAQGLDAMLGDLLGSLDAVTLLKSFQQLASKHPAEVYQYVVEVLERGAITEQRNSMKRRLGFPIAGDANGQSEP